MKLRTVVVATSAALFSMGAIAADDMKKSQSSASQGSQSTPSASQSSSAQPSASQSSSGGASQAKADKPAKQAMKSDDKVKQAQEKLSQQGYDVGQADGVMGPKTQAALKKLQEDRGLKQSGQLDQETLAALDSGAQRAATPSSTSAGGTAGGSSSQSTGSASGASSSPSTPAASQSSDKPKQ